MNIRNWNSGFTLIELVLGISILGILMLIGTWHWRGAENEQALSKDTLGLISIFEEARSLAVSSKSNSAFGVHMSSSTISVFQGDTYTGSNTIITNYNLNSLVQVYSINLNGGGNNVFFERLTGNTSQNGNIKLSLINDASSSSTVTILASGIVQ